MSNKIFYTLILMIVVALIGAGIFVVNAFGGSSLSVVGHSAGEIEGVCRSDGTGCVAEYDPTVNSYVKDKGSCVAITGGAGLCDGVDNIGISSETDPTVSNWAKGGSCPCGTCWVACSNGGDRYLCTPIGSQYVGYTNHPENNPC